MVGIAVKFKSYAIASGRFKVQSPRAGAVASRPMLSVGDEQRWCIQGGASATELSAPWTLGASIVNCEIV